MHTIVSLRTKRPSLESVALFRGCSPRELRSIEQLTTGIAVSADRALCTQGEIGGEFFVIVEGTATVVRDGRAIASLGPGQSFGELTLLSVNGALRRSATIVANEPMQLLVFTRGEFISLLQQVPVVARRLLTSVSEMALSLSARQQDQEPAPARSQEQAPTSRRPVMLAPLMGFRGAAVS